MPSRGAVTVRPVRRVHGRVTLPGDKSISHRYALLAALSHGASRLANYAPGADCASTLACLAALGVEIRRDGHRRLDYRPRRRRASAAPGRSRRRQLRHRRCGCWPACWRAIRSLRRSPATRRSAAGRCAASSTPLAAMGARLEAQDGRPPLRITGGSLRGITFTPEVPSAQVKSAVLLAGLQAEGTTVVVEPVPTRDHTERALAAFGGRIDPRRHRGSRSREASRSTVATCRCRATSRRRRSGRLPRPPCPAPT